MQRILVLRGGAIGDFVLTAPVLTALREHRPGIHIGLMGYPRTNRLAVACGLVDSCRSLDDADTAALFSAGTSPTPAFAEYLHSFDTVISYLNDPENRVRDSLSKLCPGNVTCCPPLPVPGLHAADHLCAPLTLLGIPAPASAIPRLNMPAELMEKGRDLLRGHGERVIILHPGSGSPKKNWPAAKFAELAERLRENTLLTPVFTFGEADSVVRAELARLLPDMKALPACDLPELAAALAVSRGYVGNDSGITHLAAAVGTHVTALFGPTDPAAWGPRGENVAVIRAVPHTMEALALERAVAGMQTGLTRLRLSGFGGQAGYR